MACKLTLKYTFLLNTTKLIQHYSFFWENQAFDSKNKKENENIFYICIQVFHVVNGQKFRCSSYSETSEVHELYNLKKQLFVSLEEKNTF